MTAVENKLRKVEHDEETGLIVETNTDIPLSGDGGRTFEANGGIGYIANSVGVPSRTGHCALQRLPSEGDRAGRAISRYYGASAA